MVKTVLITGGSGFIGHHLVEHILKNTDWNIIILDNLNYAGSLNRITDISIFKKQAHRIKFVWHDLKSAISETTNNLIGNFDYVVHLAAESHVDKSIENSIPFVLSNVLGTANLLEWLKKKNKRIIIFSTDEVFGPAPQNVFFKENDAHKPSNPYSATKSGEEMLAYSFAHTFGMDIIITRCMNVFGERQHPEKFVPKTIKAILNNKKVVLHGKNKNIISQRCWIHARSVADAILFILKKGKSKEFYHIVGEERTVFEIANIIMKVIKKRPLYLKDIRFIDFHKTRPGHDRRYALDGTKLKELGWKPPLSIEQSLIKTVKWAIKKENRKWL